MSDQLDSLKRTIALRYMSDVHSGQLAAFTSAITLSTAGTAVAVAAAGVAQVVPNYTPEEINTFVQNRGGLDTQISYAGFPIGGTTKTWREYFEETITIEIAETDDPNSAQIEFYKNNINLFSTDQKKKIDKFLILQGDLSSVSINRRFLSDRSEFEAVVREKVNSSLRQAYRGPDVNMKRFVIEPTAIPVEWTMPFVSGDTIPDKVYQAYESQKDSIGIGYSELLIEQGEIKAGEIQGVGNLSDIDQPPPISLNGKEAMDEAYLEYVDAIIKDSEELGQETYQEILDNQVREAKNTFLSKIRRLHVFKRREAKFLTLAAIDPDTIQEDEPITAKQYGDLSSEYNKKLNESLSELGEGALPDASPIDFEARKKVFEQCALLSDIDNLSKKYSTNVLKDNLYDGRVYLARTTEGGTVDAINKLLAPKQKSIKSFLQITPDVASMLVPKIELFLVRRSKQNKTEKIRFDFPTSTTPNIENIFRGGNDMLGTEFGIKSFSFSFEGTNPATSRNDIVAKLTLFFQNFNDFVKERGDSPRFVDLILYDRGTKQSTGLNSVSKNQYNPDYYRIMAEVGWQIPTDKKIIEDINKRHGPDGYKSLKTALQKTNKSFYLNMVEHEMDFKDDGTFEITAEYRAYIESALKGPQFDALATSEILRRRDQRQKEYQEVVESGECNVEGLIQLNRAFQVEDLELIKEAYQSIIGRLLCKNRIFIAQANAIDIQNFSKNGYFKNPCRWEDDGLPSAEADQQEPRPVQNTTEKSTINYFFLGDLIHTILDSGYAAGDLQNITTPFENTNVVLLPFELQDGSKKIQLNIADIPVSVDFFIEWYTENVIAPERQSYPIMNFIRDITNNLVVDLLSEQCRYLPLENKIRFNTSTILVRKDDAGDPIGTLTKQGTIRFDLNREHLNDRLPLDTDDLGEGKFEDYHNYLIVYPMYSNVQPVGRGNQLLDGARGTYHFDIGADRGLVKRIKFSKVDMQYIRESRFFQQGTQNLSQLAAVYKASIDMIGNTIYYPGMEIFINPRGLGTNMDPTNRNSVANSLGFGGYHLVTRVNSSITPSFFSTNVEAMFVYSGDGSSPLIYNKENRETDDIQTPLPVSQDCNTIINNAETNVQIISRPGLVDFEDLQSLTAGADARRRAEEAQQAQQAALEDMGFGFVGPTQPTEE